MRKIHELTLKCNIHYSQQTVIHVNLYPHCEGNQVPKQSKVLTDTLSWKPHAHGPAAISLRSQKNIKRDSAIRLNERSSAFFSVGTIRITANTLIRRSASKSTIGQSMLWLTHSCLSYKFGTEAISRPCVRFCDFMPSAIKFEKLLLHQQSSLQSHATDGRRQKQTLALNLSKKKRIHIQLAMLINLHKRKRTDILITCIEDLSSFIQATASRYSTTYIQ